MLYMYVVDLKIKGEEETLPVSGMCYATNHRDAKESALRCVKRKFQEDNIEHFKFREAVVADEMRCE